MTYEFLLLLFIETNLTPNNSLNFCGDGVEGRGESTSIYQVRDRYFKFCFKNSRQSQIETKFHRIQSSSP